MMSDNRFWEFSCSFYPIAEKSFLRLQDDGGFNVSMLLFCCWLGFRGESVSSEQIGGAKFIVDGYERGYIGILRDLRRRVKESDLPSNLYSEIKALELSFERCVHDELLLYCLSLDLVGDIDDDCGGIDDDCGGIAGNNLGIYIDLFGKSSKLCWVLAEIGVICGYLLEYGD